MTITPRLQQTSLVHPVGVAVGGYIAKWDERQAVHTSSGEREVYFTSETDFGTGYYPEIPLIWHLAQDPEQGARPVGKIHTIKGDEFGLWVLGHLFLPRTSGTTLVDQIHALILEKAVNLSFGTVNITPVSGTYDEDGRVLYAPIGFVSINPISKRMQEIAKRNQQDDTTNKEEVTGDTVIA